MVNVESVRLFVAIPLDDAVRKAMRRIDWWVDHLDRFRKVPPRNRHITVAFLGDVPASAVPAITAALDRCLDRRAGFVMPALGVVAMPSDRRQRALAIELDAGSGFGELASAVRLALLETPARERILSESDRPARPHITVARKKRTGGSARVDVSGAPPIECPIRCSGVGLIRSELTPQGPIYTTLEAWSLTG